jgi:hypothetical protein
MNVVNGATPWTFMSPLPLFMDLMIFIAFVRPKYGQYGHIHFQEVVYLERFMITKLTPYRHTQEHKCVHVSRNQIVYLN